MIFGDEVWSLESGGKKRKDKWNVFQENNESAASNMAKEEFVEYQNG